MALKESTVVLIDGGYYSEISKYFGNGYPIRDVDIKQFGITLAKSQNLWCKEVHFFTAPPYQSENPNQEEIERRKNYDKWVYKVKKIPDLHIHEGRCQFIDGEYRQKAVDTLVVMELLELCKGKAIKTFVLLACDTDFVPLLNKLRADGFKIILFYFTDKQRKSKFSMSNHILTACDLKVLITKDCFLRSVKNNDVVTRNRQLILSPEI